MNDNCIFCKIIKGEIPSYTIYEDEYCKGILDISPVSKGHVIMIAKKHFKDILSLPEDFSLILTAVSKVAKAMKEELQFDGLNILQNNGEIAGQTIFHFHIHLIPRFIDDGISLAMNHIDFTKEEYQTISEGNRKKIK